MAAQLTSQATGLNPKNIILIHDDQLRTTSLKVAEAFGKQHKDVLRKLDSLDCSSEFTERNFALSEYQDATGRKLPMWEMTKDGFMFLVMGFTGKKAAQVKEQYINAFNWMADQLQLRERIAAGADKLPPASGPVIRLASVMGVYRDLVRRRGRPVDVDRLAQSYLGVSELGVVDDMQAERGIEFFQQMIAMESGSSWKSEELAHIPFSLLWQLCNQAAMTQHFMEKASTSAAAAGNTVAEVESYMGHSMRLPALAPRE
ncbi:Rha family transcriptional regulator [Marinobacterium iners]|uniref:Phage regulatory protein, rha family n=1 Tax=Marinobacterium iners DSM 11526 TaxID=1122198 RepID=A0A1H3X2W6_9GAMM|nr:Rha family transcriptional regulator [Marinobacterium iners]SDZ93739.1 phage regulatory protein, rha family [Marinobacterium iners DSM 11526]